MDYIREAVQILKSYNDLEKSLSNMLIELKEIKSSMDSIKSIEISDMPRGSSSIHADDAIANKIFKRNLISKNFIATKKEIDKIDKILKGLTDAANDEESKYHERLLRLWFIDNKSRTDIMDELKCSQSGLYRMKDNAIRRFATQKFGIRVNSA